MGFISYAEHTQIYVYGIEKDSHTVVELILYLTFASLWFWWVGCLILPW